MSDWQQNKNKWKSQRIHKKYNKIQYASKHYIYANQQIYQGNNLTFRRKYPAKQRMDKKKCNNQRSRKKIYKQMAFDFDDFMFMNRNENYKPIQTRTPINYHQTYDTFISPETKLEYLDIESNYNHYYYNSYQTQDLHDEYWSSHQFSDYTHQFIDDASFTKFKAKSKHKNVNRNQDKKRKLISLKSMIQNALTQGSFALSKNIQITPVIDHQCLQIVNRLNRDNIDIVYSHNDIDMNHPGFEPVWPRRDKDDVVIIDNDDLEFDNNDIIRDDLVILTGAKLLINAYCIKWANMNGIHIPSDIMDICLMYYYFDPCGIPYDINVNGQLGFESWGRENTKVIKHLYNINGYIRNRYKEIELHKLSDINGRSFNTKWKRKIFVCLVLKNDDVTYPRREFVKNVLPIYFVGLKKWEIHEHYWSYVRRQRWRFRGDLYRLMRLST